MILLLLCLLFGVATTMYLYPQLPLKNNEDNTCLFEKKTKDNYFFEGDNGFVYDASAFTYEGYWLNMYDYLLQGELYFGGCDTPTLNNDILLGTETAYASNLYPKVTLSIRTGEGASLQGYKMYSMALTCTPYYDSGYIRFNMGFMFLVPDDDEDFEWGFYHPIYFDYNAMLWLENRQVSVASNTYGYEDLLFSLPILDFGFAQNIYTGEDKSNSYGTGYIHGYDEGYQKGYQDTYDSAYQSGYDLGEQNGWLDGYDDARAIYENQDAVANSIFSGIFSVGLLPVNVFLKIFDWNVFGINIAGFISGLLSIAVIVIVLRFILGRKE